MKNNLKYFFSTVLHNTSESILRDIFLSPQYLYIMQEPPSFLYKTDSNKEDPDRKEYLLSDFVRKYNDYLDFPAGNESLKNNEPDLYDFFMNYMDPYYFASDLIYCDCPSGGLLISGVDTEKLQSVANQAFASGMNVLLKYFTDNKMFAGKEPSYTLEEICAALANCCYEENKFPFSPKSDPFPRVWRKNLNIAQFTTPLSKLLFVQENPNSEILIATALEYRFTNLDMHQKRAIIYTPKHKYASDLLKETHQTDHENFEKEIFSLCKKYSKIPEEIKQKIGLEVYGFYLKMEYIPNEGIQNLLATPQQSCHRQLRKIFCEVLLKLKNKEVVDDQYKLRSFSQLYPDIFSSIPDFTLEKNEMDRISDCEIIKYLPFVVYSFITATNLSILNTNGNSARRKKKQEIIARNLDIFKSNASIDKKLYKTYPHFWESLLFSSRRLSSIEEKALDFDIAIFRQCMESCYLALYNQHYKEIYCAIDFLGSIALFISSFSPSKSEIKFNTYSDNPLITYKNNPYMHDFLGYSDEMKIITSSQKMFHYIIEKLLDNDSIEW